MSKSPERIEFERQLQNFAASLPPESVVYDIGKSRMHDYRETFAGHQYFSVDCNEETCPDILHDVESPPRERTSFVRGGAVITRYRMCGAIICNGVTEQCSDVGALLRGCRALLRDSGVALFGIIGPGYPLMEGTDRVRLTPQGVRNYLTTSGFRIDGDLVLVRRGGVPSYAFARCSAEPK